MRTDMLRRSVLLAAGLLACAPALGQVCDIDSPASPSTLIDTGFNQSIAKDGNGGWYTTADPVTGKYTPGMRLFDGTVLDQAWERRNPDGTVTLTKNTLPTLNHAAPS